MGRDLAREYTAARDVFEAADDALGFAISAICFDGPEDKLVLTEYTQPAILTNSIAVLRALQAEAELSFDVCAGHSLGEFSALVAAGALDLADAVKLVHLRGKAMQKAVPEGAGAMAAIMGMDLADLEALCADVAGDSEMVCDPANLNGGGQIVISGHRDAIERAAGLAKERGAKRAVVLQVSAPFHCALMSSAAEAVREALADVAIAELTVPVVANVSAEPNRDPEQVKDLLVRQVTAPVRWADSVAKLTELGVTRAYELGSGSVLRGLVRRVIKALGKTLDVTTIGEPHEVAQFKAGQIEKG